MKRVTWDLGSEMVSPFSPAQLATSPAWAVRRSAVSGTRGEEAAAVKSSAYETWRSAVLGWSDTKRLKRRGVVEDEVVVEEGIEKDVVEN